MGRQGVGALAADPLIPIFSFFSFFSFTGFSESCFPAFSMSIFDSSKRLPYATIPKSKLTYLSVRLTKVEMKRLKLTCIDLGVSMQNFVRSLILNQEIVKRRKVRRPKRPREKVEEQQDGVADAVSADD